MTADKPRVVALVGATGTGKTSIAVNIARQCGAEIINADSRQVYRRLDIGSAKPTQEEQAQARHHVIDVVEPDEPFDAATFRERAMEAIRDIVARGRRAFVVGGTGLYVKALRGGLFEGPKRDDAIRDRLTAAESRNPGFLVRELERMDPETARRLHPNDLIRHVRALEVFELTGRPISELQREHAFQERELDMSTLGLEMDRAEIYRRIDARVESMVASGLVEEVQELYATGYSPDLASFKSPGYREIGAFVRGECSLEKAKADMAQATRRLAKRQLTWFRNDPELVWVTPAEIADRCRAHWRS